ncbi:ABC transporter permease [Virgibacillus dokdonensis]|uniref:ABC transporter permease n=1 Tax=Virgibacillus dokdonensis TaxID=302167 RepID=A0A3E0WGW4_9BACI|nr:ABC transporter permease [Virgibacillus dokdonensis]RFA32134.1 ABC transporter permease [Virgibacillus dokdonensis]
MLGKQLLVECKRTCTVKNILIWIGIIILVPTLRFYTIKEGYQFFEPIEVFQEMVSTIIPLLFPALVIVIYLPTFLQEQRNNFISYTRTRIPLNAYLLSKALMNACLTGLVTFLLIFIPFVFAMYVEPNLEIIYYSPIDENTIIPSTTFSQFLSYGDLAYGLVYSLWVSINAALYSTIAFMLLLVLNNPFVAISIPFLFYHIFNFITGVLAVPQFSPLSTIFPFNIVEQPFWTLLIPFSFLVFVLIGLYVFANRNKSEWMI